jgi:chemotaxis protein CheD
MAFLPASSPSAAGGPPPGLSGFEHVNRYWDRTRGTFAAKILPGEYYVTREREIVTTVLGSCVSACIRDPLAGVGGMNHFMRPLRAEDGLDPWAGTGVDRATRYGNYAMEHLINDVMKYGGQRARLAVKVFGGGRVLRADIAVGDTNVDFVLGYLEGEGLRVAARDLGGPHPRKVVYEPSSGRVWMKRLRSLHNDTVVERERRYLSDLRRQPADSGGIDLFD